MAKTHIGKALNVAEAKVQYDDHVKNVLADRKILAWILKSTVEEVKEMNIQEIISCLGDEIIISQVPVNPGETNQPQKIVGDSGEDEVPYEGMVRFDLRFHLKLPGTGEQDIKLLINLEAQKEYYKKYDFVTRGIFYAARMISAQLDTEFSNSNYQDIKKVYSIWICMNAPQYIGNALARYTIVKEDLVGETPDKPKSYDKLAVLIICLNEESTSEDGSLFELLNVLLSSKMKIEEKEQVLKEEYGIDVEKKVGEELNQMCNLSEAIEERGIEKGLAKGLKKGVKASIELCRELGLSREETLEKIKEKFDESAEEAEKHLSQYWK